MSKNLQHIFLSILLLLLLPFGLNGQEVTKITPYIQLRYLKNTDNQRILTTTLTYSKNRMELPLAGMQISFQYGADKKELAGSVLTDEKGIARFDLGNVTELLTDKKVQWAFSTEFKGNDSIEPATSEVAISDVVLELKIDLVDTVRTILVKAFTLENGKEKPVAGEAVKVSVPRMFSKLLIGELTLDETGQSSVEFPSDLPGDKDGKLTIIAGFEENEKFGNVEKVETMNWGVRTDYTKPSSHRALWTKTPPRWMIFTLSILLTGVWGHYMFAIISLIRIRRNAKRKLKEEYKI